MAPKLFFGAHNEKSLRSLGMEIMVVVERGLHYHFVIASLVLPLMRDTH